MVYVSRRIVYAKKLHNLIEKRFSHRFCGVQIERLLKIQNVITVIPSILWICSDCPNCNCYQEKHNLSPS